MKLKWMTILILVLLLATAFVLIKNYNESIKAAPIDNLNLDKDEIKECCNYFEKGEEKTCVVLKRFDCNLCEARCG